MHFEARGTAALGTRAPSPAVSANLKTDFSLQELEKDFARADRGVRAPSNDELLANCINLPYQSFR
jgi:hypothetical protein